MNMKEELRINGYQPAYGWTDTVISDFFQETINGMTGNGFRAENNVIFLMSQAYTYGVIQGKRAERARRKKTR